MSKSKEAQHGALRIRLDGGDYEIIKEYIQNPNISLKPQLVEIAHEIGRCGVYVDEESTYFPPNRIFEINIEVK